MSMISIVQRRAGDHEVCTWILALAFLWSGSVALAAPTVLDFEDLPAGTVVTAQYGPRGVIFLNHFLDTDPAARSGTRVLRTASLAEEIFTPIPLAMTFTSAQARVRLFAASTGVALNGTLTAFDAADNVVAQDGPKLVAVGVFNAEFEVTDPDATPSIARAELRLENGIYFAIDDLEFEGEPPAPPPPTPPVVQITSPPDGADLDVSTLDIAGTVTGEGLLSPVKLTVIFAQPPESTAPPFTSDLELTGTGTQRQFALQGFTGVPMGPVTITVTAQNFAAQAGSASVTITNFPDGIRNRLRSEGGAGEVGPFQFGLFLNGCKVAVFERAAISDTGLLISGDILSKWLALKGPSGAQTGFFGCPLGDERSGTGDSRVQDFQGGRIYSTPSIGTFQVPAVFVEAIEERGGEAATGVPLADPVTPVEQVTQTWLYQQFTRPDRPDLFPSTLEIRGNPPVLWMERQGWNLTFDTSATVYERFPCSDLQGPCEIEPLEESTEQMDNAGDLFCEGTRYPLGVPEWVGIPSANPNYESIPMFGVITDSHMASEDNPFTHEWSYDAAPFCSKAFGCPSDWNLEVHPIGPQPGAFPLPSLFGKSNSVNVEVEYERFYGDFVAWMGYPKIGDLFYGEGRWIIDCGHTTYNSELHPIFMWSVMSTVTQLIQPFTGLIIENPFGGQPATQANVWVNGWYPGGAGQEIEFDIFPPPRPSPGAMLVVNKPVDEDAATDEFQIQYEFAPAGAANHVHIKISAPRHESFVTDAGEMIWEINRGYEGQWYLFWSE